MATKKPTSVNFKSGEIASLGADTTPPPPRCINCLPAFRPGRHGMGMCHRFPHAEKVIKPAEHFCLEHPALKTSPLTEADLKA